MALGKRTREQSEPMWVVHADLPRGPGHPFYARLNALLDEHGFDSFVEDLCRPFYAEVMGRPGLAPGIYFRCLLIGYFEGIGTERGIAWRAADSLNLREFLGIEIDRNPPDHSTISRTRRLIDLETHVQFFSWTLGVLTEHGLLQGKTIGVDATTVEANAAMRSIVRRDTKETYEEFLHRLAVASGIETPTREDLARLDRKRKKKGSNEEWEHPHDPDAKITKMKNGSTHLAHKLEYAVDLKTEAIVGVTVQGADEGDTTTFPRTILEAMEQLSEPPPPEAQSPEAPPPEPPPPEPPPPEAQSPEVESPASTVAKPGIRSRMVEEVVMDKGGHSNQMLVDLEDAGIRSYVSEPQRGRRRWKGKPRERAAVYANRRRIRSERGKRLFRMRSERGERPFAHTLVTGGLRRTELRGRENNRKRYLVQAAGFDLGLVMRQLIGRGTPRGMSDCIKAVLRAKEQVVEKAGKAVSAASRAAQTLIHGLIRLTRCAQSPNYRIPGLLDQSPALTPQLHAA